MTDLIIPLTQGQSSVVDECDIELTRLTWSAWLNKSYSGGGKFVARRNEKTQDKRITLLLHRVVMGRILGRLLLPTELVDHWNNDPLDNRRGNLRLASHAQNVRNRVTPSNNTSGYKGVSWAESMHKWHAQISVNGKVRNLGYFHSKEEAFDIYCKAAIEYHKEFANFGNERK